MVADEIKTWVMCERAELPMSLNFPGQFVFNKKDFTAMGYVTDSTGLDFFFLITFLLYLWT